MLGYRLSLGRSALAGVLIGLLLAATASPWNAPVVASELPRFVGHGGPVKAVVVTPDGRTGLTGSFDYSLIRWSIDGENISVEARYIEHEGAVNDVALTPSGTLALSASDDGTVGVWDIAADRLITRLKGHRFKVVALAVSPDGGTAVSASWDGTARLWDLQRMSPAGVLRGHAGNVNSVAFSLDGNTVYTAGYDGTIRVWDVATASLKRVLYKHGWGVNVIRMLPGGDRLLFGALDGTVAILDLDSGEIAKLLQPYEGPVLAASVWPRENLAAAGGGNGVVRVWDLNTWELLQELENPYGPVWSLALSGDGDMIYYAGLDDFVVGWQFSPRQPFEPVVGEFPRRFQREAAMDPGERQFARKCSICHTLTPDGGNRAGPTLYSLFGRRAGTVAGYSYSSALANSDIVWTEATIAQLFDHGPDQVTPGSKMPLQRLRSVEDRDALIAFLRVATRGAESAISDREAPVEEAKSHEPQ